MILLLHIQISVLLLWWLFSPYHYPGREKLPLYSFNSQYVISNTLRAFLVMLPCIIAPKYFSVSFDILLLRPYKFHHAPSHLHHMTFSSTKLHFPSFAPFVYLIKSCNSSHLCRTSLVILHHPQINLCSCLICLAIHFCK